MLDNRDMFDDRLVFNNLLVGDDLLGLVIPLWISIKFLMRFEAADQTNQQEEYSQRKNNDRRSFHDVSSK